MQQSRRAPHLCRAQGSISQRASQARQGQVLPRARRAPHLCGAQVSAAWQASQGRQGHELPRALRAPNGAQGSKDSKFAVEGNFDHAIESLGESVCMKPLNPLHERVVTSLSAQMSQGTSHPLHSVFTNRGMLPPP